MAEKSATDLIVEANRHARELSLVLTEAHRRGIMMDVEVDRLPVGGQGDIVQVMIYPTKLPRD